MKLELIGYPIIKNKVSPMLRTRSKTEALTFALSSKVERKDKGRKDLTASLTSVLSRKGREELKGCPPHPCPLPRGGEERKRRKRV
jgi:hypothetical protein